MSILKVARMGHPVLRAKARALTPADVRTHDIQRLIDDMFETMTEYHGVGPYREYFRIHGHQGGTILVVFFVRVEVGDKDAQFLVDLRRRQADASVLGHRLDHVIDQFLNG